MSRKKSQKNTLLNAVPTGHLIIIGGAEDKDPECTGQALTDTVLAEFIRLCGKKPVIELITSAGNQEIEDTYKEYEQCFSRLGASSTGHIHHDGRTTDFSDLIPRIEKANGIFFTGGDQLKLTAVYGGSELISAIRERYFAHGLTIGGTSAGAMAMSSPMIYDGQGEKEMVAAEVKVTTGLGFLQMACIDTHFVHRGRFVRMAQVLATNPGSVGIGIEENTAIVLSGGCEAKVIGDGVVIVSDAKRISGSNITSFDENRKISVRGLEVSILSKDDTFTIPAP
jgi:cyanophycinase